MSDDLEAAEDERAIELSSIAAIFPELVVDGKDPYTATLDLAVTPVKPLRILFKPSTDNAPPGLPTPPISSHHGQDGLSDVPAMQQPLPLDDYELSHLPPLSLHITLPEGYPTTKPPAISISMTPQWLGRKLIEHLRKDCARLWEELGKDQVVYAYIDHIQQEAEQAFGLAGETSASMPSDLQLALLDFDLKAKRQIFEKQTFDCGVCLEPKKGGHCYKIMACGHVSCISCLQDFYNNCITEGDVDNVKCLDYTCGKDTPARDGPDGRPLKRRKRDRTLNPSELLQIPISQEQVQRYVRLKRKQRLESNKNTVYCPRQWCQGAARSESHPEPANSMNDVDDDDDSEDEGEQKQELRDPETLPMAERLAICEDCSFAFCVVCKKTWHGENARCSPRRQAELSAEEKASAEYFAKYSTPCPTCNAPAQKSMGCNHMTCFKCKTHFCYLCAAFLMPDNPYTHYNDRDSQCYMKLWELEAGDGEGVDRHAFHAAEFPPEWEAAAEAAEAEDEPEEPELPPENFDAFNGDRPAVEEEDSENEEPAPDQRRNRNVIEIVNYARQGGQNAHVIELPERPRQPDAIPPQAPDAPRDGQRRGRRRYGIGRQPFPPPARELNHRGQFIGRRDNRVRAPRDVRIEEGLDRVGQEAIAQVEPAGDDDIDYYGPLIQLPPAAPGQGNQQAGPVRGMGLDRFLELANQDQEDEWDSDELGDDGFDDMEFDHEPRRDRRR